ncbi:MAG: hypothetical protein GY730_04030 [bacterium]|nr:hypothetical protein [bacterium]
MNKKIDRHIDMNLLKRKSTPLVFLLTVLMLVSLISSTAFSQTPDISYTKNNLMSSKVVSKNIETESTKNKTIDVPENDHTVKKTDAKIELAMNNNITKQPDPDKNSYPPEFKLLKKPQKESFLYPARHKSQYPDLNVSGFYEGKYSQRNYEPKTVTSSLWETIRKDPVYNKLPRDVLIGDPKIEFRYKFNIDGKLDDDLSVHYDVEQEPDFPGKYDIRVKYKKTDLTFYHFDAEFKNGEFINIKKALNGAKLETYDDNWEAIIATGRQRSDPKKFEGWGNGGRKYNLGHGNILEDSIKIWVNNVLIPDSEIEKINYYEGSIEFKNLKTQADYIEVIYEFTNPIEDFIPVLSRKNFMGAQYKWHASVKPKIQKLSKSTTELLVISSRNIKTQEFKLKNNNIVLGESSVELNGKKLKNSVDYTLKSHTGKLTLHEKHLKEKDKIKVSYSYYLTEQISEEIIGKDIPGPYNLSKIPVVNNSEKIYLNDVLLYPIRDYNLNYKTGKLMFNYKIQYPHIISAEYHSFKTETPSVNVTDSPLSIGATYIQESVSGQDEELDLTSPSENFTTTSNIIRTKNTPVINTANIDIVLTVNNKKITLTTADYEVVNPYKGEIRVIDTLVTGSPPYTGTVKYKYKKSYKSIFSFLGKEGHLKYTNGENDFFLTEIPIKYKGIDEIRVRISNEVGDRLLEEGIDYTVDYSNDGTKPSITFIPGETLHDGRQLPSDFPSSNDRIYMVYDYAPDNSPDPGNINQRMVGFTLGTKINDHWSLNAEVAAADHNFSKPQLDFEQSMTGRGDTFYEPYKLEYNNLVEDSESVFIKRETGESYMLTKDRDYIINYITGHLKFIRQSPGNADTIIVKAKYYSNQGTVEAGAQHNFKLAMKVDTEYKNDNITIKGNYKSIDKDFLPMGEMKEQKGSKVLGGSFNWDINEKEKISMDYNRRDLFKDSNAKGQNSYLHTDDFNANADLVFFDMFETSQSLRYQLQIQDPVDPDSPTPDHIIDTKTIDYSGSVAFGPDSFKNTISRGFTRTNGDYIDAKAPDLSIIDKEKYESQIDLKDLWVLGDIVINPAFEQQSTNKKVTRLLTNTGEYITEKSYSNRRSSALYSRLTPFKELTGTFDFSKDEIETQTPKQTSANINTVQNESYELSYKPFSWFNLLYNKRHQEAESALANQTGRVEDNTSFKITRFAPMGLLSVFGLSDSNFLLAPIKSSYFTLSTNEKRTEEHDKQKIFTSSDQSYKYNNFKPLPGVTIKSIDYSKRRSERDDKVGNQSTSGNYYISNYSKKGGSMSIIPPLPVLNLFVYDYTAEKRSDSRETFNLADSSTSNTVIESLPLYSHSESLTFSPGNIVLAIPKVLRVDFGKLSASMKQSQKDITNKKTTFYYSPKDKENASKSIHLNDNSHIRSLTYACKVSPFNIFNLSGIHTRGLETYDRNMNPANTGFTHKILSDSNLDGTYQPFSFISFSGSYIRKNIYQYRSDTLNLSPETLIKDSEKQSPSLLKDSLANKERRYSIGSTFSPFNFISIRGKAEYSNLIDISEKVVTESSTTAKVAKENPFYQITGSSGIVLKPFSSLSISYDYALKYTSSEKIEFISGENKNKGYEGTAKISFTPLKQKDFQVSFIYTRVDSGGYDFNTLSKGTIEQGTGDTINTQIVQRADYVETATMKIDITLPLPNAPYIDSFVISGEGYLKKIHDLMDNNRPETEKNSYEISGMVIKGTLLF